MNKYGIGERLTKEQYDEMLDTRAATGLANMPRKVEDYWSVYHRNLNHSEDQNDALKNRVIEAYLGDPNEASFWLQRDAFVTDDAELAMEIYKHIQLDFVYDFKTGLWFMDLFGGHETTMGQLYELAQSAKRGKGKSTWKDAAEEYVMKGYGMFKSSQSRRINIGPDVAIPDFFRPYRSLIEVME